MDERNLHGIGTRIRFGVWSVLFAAVVLGTFGCHGPLTAPAIRRLDPDQQAQVDRMWENMLATPDRLDRSLLLDVLLAFELHQSGVDKANYHAEKIFSGGVVLMDMSFDRSRPMEDWFFIEIRDKENHSVRKEHYCGDEIWSHYNEMMQARLGPATTQSTTSPATTQPGTQPTQEELREQRLEFRLQEIIAATQPVTVSH